jgi:hypothetical protein
MLIQPAGPQAISFRIRDGLLACTRLAMRASAASELAMRERISVIFAPYTFIVPFHHLDFRNNHTHKHDLLQNRALLDAILAHPPAEALSDFKGPIN